MMRALFLIALLPALAGCGASPPGAALFPLEAGRQWTYDVKTEWADNRVEHENLTLTAHGTDTLESGTAWRRHSDTGVDYWLRADASGIYRVASKSDLEAEPRPDAAPRYVLKAPIATGTSWQADTTAYLLYRPVGYPREIRYALPAFPMVYTIEATAEKVATQAGEFDGCVRVKGIATVHLYADPIIGWIDLPITTLEWYCPNVGLVRLERNESTPNTQANYLSGGVLTMDLVASR